MSVGPFERHTQSAEHGEIMRYVSEECDRLRRDASAAARRAKDDAAATREIVWLGGELAFAEKLARFVARRIAGERKGRAAAADPLAPERRPLNVV